MSNQHTKTTRYFLGIDLGTSSLKVTILNDTGQTVASAGRDYPTRIPQPGWAEQESEDWLLALRAALAELWSGDDEMRRAVVGVGVCSAAHIPVLLDADMRVLRPGILWHDTRAEPQVQRLTQQQRQAICAITANTPSCGWTLPQLLWIRENEPELFARARLVLTSKDYINFILTGVTACDESSAAATMLYDLRKHDWCPQLRDLCGLPEHALPQILPPLAHVGSITAQAAAMFGIPTATPVIAGMLDSAAEVLSAGAVTSGKGVVRLGTAGGIMLTGSLDAAAERLITYPHPLCPGAIYQQAGTNCCALALRWLRSLLRDDAGAELSWERIDQLAQKAGAGAGGLLFHPYLQGERAPYWNSRLRGSFTGQRLEHGREEHIRAVMEGVAYSLRDCLECFDKTLPTELALVGGGGRSRVWPQIVADVMGVPLLIVKPGDSTHGVAWAAAMASGARIGNPAADSEERLYPDPVQAREYHKRFSLYRKVQKALEPLYTDEW